MVKNEGETWPQGTVNVYRDMYLIGQDQIEWTPMGREAKVTVGYAPDIEVKKRATSKTLDRYDYSHAVTLSLKNYKDEPATVEVIDNYPQHAIDFEAGLDYEEKPGNLLYWTITLAPGEQRNVTYSYWTD